MMTSRTFKAVSRDSTAALEKWRRGAQEISLINSLEPFPGNGDPRFLWDEDILDWDDIQDVMIDNPDFAQLTPHKQFNLLFQFQAHSVLLMLCRISILEGIACTGTSGNDRCGSKRATSSGCLHHAGPICSR
jgi:hypothetical protein